MDSRDLVPLGDLAVEINAEHGRVEDCAGRALIHALNVGRMLEQVKGRLRHGDRMPWVNEHCAFSPRTAQTYMRLHRKLGWALGDGPPDAQHAALFDRLKEPLGRFTSIREALAELAVSERPAGAAREDFGESAQDAAIEEPIDEDVDPPSTAPPPAPMPVRSLTRAVSDRWPVPASADPPGQASGMVYGAPDPPGTRTVQVRVEKPADGPQPHIVHVVVLPRPDGDEPRMTVPRIRYVDDSRWLTALLPSWHGPLREAWSEWISGLVDHCEVVSHWDVVRAALLRHAAEVGYANTAPGSGGV
jgi:hypothetical protein